ncbi:MAG: hypothetical protein IPO21_18240 [Bacteroidales bacterium]|nr:hypothetical protein [Bacteroidales bacterium]
MIYSYHTLILLIISNVCFGQKNFIINDGSQNYIAEVTIENCNYENCEGAGIIKLIDKTTNNHFQTFNSEELNIYYDNIQIDTIKVMLPYNEQSLLIFNDFNFDGAEDLAIANGNNGSYGATTYNVYIYNVTKKQFDWSEELTNLTTENLGMFKIDSERKRLISYSKSGCCWHLTSEYEIALPSILVLVYELEEDASLDKYVKVTTRKWVSNKWVSKTRKYKMNRYYKE